MDVAPSGEYSYQLNGGGQRIWKKKFRIICLIYKGT